MNKRLLLIHMNLSKSSTTWTGLCKKPSQALLTCKMLLRVLLLSSCCFLKWPYYCVWIIRNLNYQFLHGCLPGSHHHKDLSLLFFAYSANTVSDSSTVLYGADDADAIPDDEEDFYSEDIIDYSDYRAKTNRPNAQRPSKPHTQRSRKHKKTWNDI